MKTEIPGGCPGSQTMDLRKKDDQGDGDQSGVRPSELGQWPIQMHLISPQAPYFQEADVLLVADCAAFAAGDFHKDFMKGKSIGIACPKLDDQQEIYEEKIVSWVNDAKINTLTVIVMQVPCCSGLIHLAKNAVDKTERKIPVKAIVMGLNGEVLSEEWL